MYSLGELIKRYRKENNISMDKFAYRSGLSKSYIAMLEKNKNPQGDPINPSFETIKKAANGMGRSYESVLDTLENKSMVSPDSKDIPTTTAYSIPLVASVIVKEPHYLEKDIIGHVEWKDQSNGKIFATKMKGDSMLPRIDDGDILIIDTNRSCKDGDIIIASVEHNDGICRRLKKYEDGLRLIPLNPSYQPEYYSDKEVKKLPVSCIGKVIQFRANL